MKNANRETYAKESVAYAYRDWYSLFPLEIVILDEFKHELPTASVLDIGIGTGRTTLHLSGQCRRYTGIDYSPTMLRIARERFPDADLREMDASDLSAFEDEHFDIVIFSFNGIDGASHECRLRIIGEVRRVLRPGGAFIFSFHNRGAPIEPAYDLKNLEYGRRPREFISGVIRYLSGIINAALMSKHERQETEYAILNDSAHEYRLLHYYITPKAQVAQLERQGFRSLFFVDHGGNMLDLEGAQLSHHSWIYCVSRKKE